MIYLKQSTASQEIVLGVFLDDTDGKTAETGLTIANTDIKIWKAGATTLANKNSGGATHISNGIYYATLDATDTATLGSLIIYVQVSGALAVKQECVVLSANNYDTFIAGTDRFNVDVTTNNDKTGYTASTVSDKTGYSLAADQSAVTIGTVTTNTDMRGTDSANTVVPPTVAELNARTIPSADYFDPAVDTVANVTLVDTTTTNTDMITTADILNSTLTDLVDTDIDNGATITMAKGLRALFNRFFRKVTQTATVQAQFNDSNANIGNMSVSDDGTTQTKGTVS